MLWILGLTQGEHLSLLWSFVGMHFAWLQVCAFYNSSKYMAAFNILISQKVSPQCLLVALEVLLHSSNHILCPRHWQICSPSDFRSHIYYEFSMAFHSLRFKWGKTESHPSNISHIDQNVANNVCSVSSSWREGIRNWAISFFRLCHATLGV